MKTALQILLYIFAAIFGLGAVAEKIKDQRETYLKGFLGAITFIIALHKLW